MEPAGSLQLGMSERCEIRGVIGHRLCGYCDVASHVLSQMATGCYDAIYYPEPAEELENPPAYFTIVDVDNPTGIDEVKGQKTDDVEIYYDLQGRRLNGTLQRGLYIKNGKKTIIK